jgi:hypothetical protein
LAHDLCVIVHLEIWQPYRCFLSVTNSQAAKSATGPTTISTKPNPSADCIAKYRFEALGPDDGQIECDDVGLPARRRTLLVDPASNPQGIAAFDVEPPWVTPIEVRALIVPTAQRSLRIVDLETNVALIVSVGILAAKVPKPPI